LHGSTHVRKCGQSTNSNFPLLRRK